MISNFDKVEVGIDMDTGKENYPNGLYFGSKYRRSVAISFYFGK